MSDYYLHKLKPKPPLPKRLEILWCFIAVAYTYIAWLVVIQHAK